MTITPIRNNGDLSAALVQVDALFNAKKGTVEHDKLEVLFTLIERYEADNHPVGPPEPVEAIKFRLEQLGRTQADFAKLFGPTSKSRASEILNKKRRLTLANIRMISSKLGIPASTLIQEYELVK